MKWLMENDYIINSDHIMLIYIQDHQTGSSIIARFLDSSVLNIGHYETRKDAEKRLNELWMKFD